MRGADVAGYFIVPVLICVLSVLCFFFCRKICVGQRLNYNSPTVVVTDPYCYRYYPTNPRHARIGGNSRYQPFPRQPQQNPSFTNFRVFSAERGYTTTHSLLNRTNFNTSQNNATIFSQENPIILSAVEPSAPDLYNILSSPGEPQLYNLITASSAPQMRNLPSQSHRLNVRVSQNSVDVDDPPPDYATVVLADMTQGNELTQFPRVIQKDTV